MPPYGNLRRRLAGTAAAGLLAAAPFALTACGGESAGPEQGADVGDVAGDDWFGDNEYVGRQVTLSATVDEVVGPRSFVLGAQDYGDDSVLVLAQRDAPDVQEGNVVQVTGTVREFDYQNYEADYALGAADLYEPYGGEEFLVAQNIDKSVPQENGTGGNTAGNTGGNTG
ncbi:hypothetical protein B0I33_114160 [Prauserella shujinwangii]|uniref:Lipoprotein n=1 Tax=Prauserella shujinwangii TaxID=1453103 RepID=A0A2T0LL68_9PSEU|nr:hypothetical protein [Prauserella shujinwangii]PRX43699.1 hypothetical protein B0I33_114160 [Prauserella shujinwangii]